MAKFSFSLALLFVYVLCIIGTVEPGNPRGRQSRGRPYIEACQGTRFPDLCIRCLSGFPNSTIQNPQQLAQVALSVSLYRARHTRSFLLDVAKQLERMKAREYPTVKDCLQQIDDSVFQLSQSIRELRRMETAPVSDDFFWHISNVETWTSAALTDASTCLDEFPAGRNTSKLKATIKGKVLNVAQVTSNALALFHRYAAKYQTKTNP
ncbi:hypothetical protein SLEP1_g2683 [Rubroshorea leprosula]|uniref:Pectinesterase inhibitor domain-containing protein n=1 Tax=Rubroshorea leprosula TaxID=152421 RepID=A0AAV5HID0_9ROSI|nr:hypothetical protein SLEP1_g2683 [Rubroshorea leprosula]